MCASRIHTIDRGWMREKEREGKEKKMERKDVETAGAGGKRRRAPGNTRNQTEQGIFLLSIFFMQRMQHSLIKFDYASYFLQIEF